MKLLALDASETPASVCVVQDNAFLFHAHSSARRTHSETLLPLVDSVLASAKLSLVDLDGFAVTSGPGSFTGLRIGLGLVKGLAMPFETPVAAVSSLEALARTLTQEGIVLAAIDARRNEVYWAFFEIKSGTFARLTTDQTGPAAQIDLTPYQNKKIFIVGGGAEVCYNSLVSSHGALAVAKPSLTTAQGAALAALAPNAIFAPAAQIRPEYLRLSQAERERKQKQQAAASDIK